MNSTIRPAAVAGRFYPADALALKAEVDACLNASASPSAGLQPPKLLIVPHAGYVYSGIVAARAFALLAPAAATLRRVVLLGPAHRVHLRGLAAPTVDAFDTPLGRVPLDHAALDALRGLPQVVRADFAHALEHSLEVQLPFLQRVLAPGFTLVPLAVGEVNADAVADVLDRLWGGPETLIVISSDLSHYLPYARAQEVDRRTVERIGACATDLLTSEACGARALNGALVVARRRGLQPVLLDLRNSGDTAGDRERVVGYAAFAAAPAPAAHEGEDDALGAALLSRARNAIGQRLGLAAQPEPEHPALAQPGATFVTLTDARGALRGCVGRLEADAVLDTGVRRNAQAAAFADVRFAPLTAAQWPGLRVSVSVLGLQTPLPRLANAAEAARQLRPGQDGIVLSWRRHMATFLPQVWTQLPQPEEFLAALLRKAGLAPDFWSAELRLARYEARYYEEAEEAHA